MNFTCDPCECGGHPACTKCNPIAFAKALMAGDPATFKAGYTLENAAIATSEVFGIDRQEIINDLSPEPDEINPANGSPRSHRPAPDFDPRIDYPERYSDGKPI